jgi:hypothetical protein
MYSCIWLLILVRGQATCRTHFALSAPCLVVVSCMKPVVPLLNLIQGFLDTRSPPDSPKCSGVSTSSTLLRGSYLDHPLADSQFRSRTPFLTASDFHWVQYIFYVGLRSAMSFHSGHRPVSASCRMGPVSVSFRCSVLRTSGSQSTAGTADIARTCFICTHKSTL